MENNSRLTETARESMKAEIDALWVIIHRQKEEIEALKWFREEHTTALIPTQREIRELPVIIRKRTS
jgi:hypothetical protein